MAAADITSDAPPIFLTRNFLNSFASVTVSKGDFSKARAFDFTRTSKWISLGSSVSESETYQAALKEGTAEAIRSVNFIALLGINLRRFIIETRPTAAGAFVTVPGGDQTGADFTASDLVLPLASNIDVESIKVTATETQAGTGNDKEIGDIIVATLQFQPIRGMFNYRRRYIDNVKTIELADGTKDYTYLYHTDDSFEFFMASISFRAITLAQRDLFLALRRNRNSFIFYPFPGNTVGDIFPCRIVPDSYEEEPLTKGIRAKSGFEIEFEIEEIGAQ